MEKSKLIENLTSEIEKLKEKSSRIYFFVVDTKGTPNASLSYIYDIAYKTKELGYNVVMLHGEKDFVGVERWLGNKYSSMQHLNVETDSVNIAPSDILIIPEILANVMFQTKDLPCKRIALLNNINYLTEIIQPGVSWEDYKIKDCITTNTKLASLIKGIFPNINVDIIRPQIGEMFSTDDRMKKPIVNIVAKRHEDVNSIVKIFFLKYPMYKWICFRELKDLSKDDFANALKEAMITLWIDTDSSFGYSAIEAMACGDVVIGRVPDIVPEWMEKEGELVDNGIWYYDALSIHNVLASVIETGLNDMLPNELHKEAVETVKYYSDNSADINTILVEKYIKGRLKEMEEALAHFKNNTEEKSKN